MSDQNEYEIHSCRNTSEDLRVPWKMVKKDKVLKEDLINRHGFSHAVKYNKNVKQKILNYHKRHQTIDSGLSKLPTVMVADNESQVSATSSILSKFQNRIATYNDQKLDSKVLNDT